MEPQRLSRRQMLLAVQNVPGILTARAEQPRQIDRLHNAVGLQDLLQGHTLQYSGSYLIPKIIIHHAEKKVNILFTFSLKWCIFLSGK
jgi:hypothetical protein